MNSSVRVIASRRYGTLSPLRYPGGKAALAGFFHDIIDHLSLRDVCYVEPYVSWDPNESFQTTENQTEGSQAESLMIARHSGLHLRPGYEQG